MGQIHMFKMTFKMILYYINTITLKDYDDMAL